MDNTKKPKTKTEDDLYSSKNHGKSKRYRVRIQQEEEAEKEIKDYEQKKPPQREALD